MKTEEKEKCFGANCSNMFYNELIINNKIYVLWKNMIYELLSENQFLYLMKALNTCQGIYYSSPQTNLLNP